MVRCDPWPVSHPAAMTHLTHGRLRQLLRYDPETGAFIRLITAGAAKAGSAAGTIIKKNGGSLCYWQIQVDGKLYLAHRLAWFFVTGEWPNSLIDHKDRDGLNNKWTNLREATYSQNQQNKRRLCKNKAGMKGVSPHGNKWRTYIGHVYLGSFGDVASAHAAYIEAATKTFGEFARAA